MLPPDVTLLKLQAAHCFGCPVQFPACPFDRSQNETRTLPVLKFLFPPRLLFEHSLRFFFVIFMVSFLAGGGTMFSLGSCSKHVEMH